MPARQSSSPCSANIFYFSTGRTALVTIFVLFVLLALKIRNVKTIAGLLAAAILLGIIAWMSSPYLRERTEAVQTEAQMYEKTNERTSTGERLEFWKKSAEFIRQAPVIGHGTGSIRALFEKAAAGQTGAAGVAAANPHNQTLAVGIQLGVLGIAVLWAMWIAHLLLFRGKTALPRGLALLWSCRILSARYSTRTSSISRRGGLRRRRWGGGGNGAKGPPTEKGRAVTPPGKALISEFFEYR